MKERFVIGLLHGSESEVFGCCARVPEMVVVEVSPNTYDRVMDLLLEFTIQGREGKK
jgi:hypothetical protein